MVTVEIPAKLLIGGEWRSGQEEKTFDIVEPATSEVMARAAVASPTDVDPADKAARQAFEGGAWSARPAGGRAGGVPGGAPGGARAQRPFARPQSESAPTSPGWPRSRHATPASR